MPVFNFQDLAENNGCLSVISRVDVSPTAQLIYTLPAMKTAAKDFGVKGLNEMDESSIANAYAYGLRKKYYSTGSHKDGFFGGKKAVVCNFSLGAGVKQDTLPPTMKDASVLLERASCHVALLGDDLAESYVVYEPEVYHPENVVNLIRKSVTEWAPGKIISNMIRLKNYFIPEDAVMTREVPDGWDIPIDLDEED